MSVTQENKYQHLILDWNFVKFLESDVYRAFKRVYLEIRPYDIFRPRIYRKITEIEKIMNAHFFKETVAQLFLFFSGVFLLENTVRPTKNQISRSFWAQTRFYEPLRLMRQESKLEQNRKFELLKIRAKLSGAKKGPPRIFSVWVTCVWVICMGDTRMGDFTCHPHSLILLATRWSFRKHFQVNVSIFVI